MFNFFNTTIELQLRVTELPLLFLSEAELYLYGGCVTSWKVGSKDLLFVRPDAVFNVQKPIRNSNWSIVDSESVDGSAVITLELKESPYSGAMWDYSFQALYKASVSGASVKGLKGCKTLNKDPDPKNPMEGKEEIDVVTYPGFVDCVYLGAPNELCLDNGLGDVIPIKNTNWPDAVLWNPHLTMEACYKDFVCVENAQIGNVDLEPEKSWVATQQLNVG
ncbi:hypothetical protein L1987_49796 [Smallanthus sonchifolius]|uniref:Uncharacterized protein n=1 Tax=Smallanthus sonchifolius TaxID=185202 RepID=A0ACB9FXC6_9ASTR|nr:hypothetical protein L1987_49796 [Smallanthus sonchifolius]